MAEKSFDIDSWMREYADAVRRTVGGRVQFIGLQGSFARGEATDTSDIDVVLILDSLSARDLADYGSLLESLPERERVCGFVSGRAEIEAWEKSELFFFCCDTVPVFGSLENLMRGVTDDDVRRAMRIGAGAAYHACVHNFLHEKSAEILGSLYKQAAFTLRAEAYLKTGTFERKLARLAEALPPDDAALAEDCLRIRQGVEIKLTDDDFARLSDRLIAWASRTIQSIR